MSTVEAVTLGSHVVAGFVALFGGAGAFVTKKGGRRHVLLGRAYVVSMAFVSVSALALFAVDPTRIRQFLALVAVFSFYFAFSGYRFLSRKRPDDPAETVDWVAVGLLSASGLGLVGMGAGMLLGGTQFGTVMLVFGGIALAFGAQDLRGFRGNDRDPRAWLYEHLTRMSAGYIATVTAFASVNFLFLPTLVRWLGPTAVGIPAIAYLRRRYESGP